MVIPRPVTTVPPTAVVGLGLMGGSLARRFIQDESICAGWDPDPATREAARAAGLVVPETITELSSVRPEVVVVAAPLRAMPTVFGELAAWAPPEATITDLGSVKGPVRQWAQRAGVGDRYVGAHPMTGTELAGFESSSSELIAGATWAVTVTPDTDLAALKRVLALIVNGTGGSALVTTDAEHDRAVARISHVPHVVAHELLSGAERSDVRAISAALAAGSFRDGTRVARTGASRSQAMVEANGRATAAALRAMTARLSELADDLERGADTSWFFAGDSPLVATPNGPGSQVEWSEPQVLAALTAAGREGKRVTQLFEGFATVQ